MNVLAELKRRFRPVLEPLADDPDPLLEMIRPAQDARFGDYQANFAMPLGKQRKQPPREIAERIVGQVDLSDFCQTPEVAGPGFINIRLRDDWLAARLLEAAPDERLGVAPVDAPRKFVVDYSSPNVAKPMHVGHIRSTVIGDAISRTLRFAGHEVITDNHLGDWGTQFGMILFGHKHFLDAEAYAREPVRELGRLYQLVNRLVAYHKTRQAAPALSDELQHKRRLLAEAEQTGGNDKQVRKRQKQLRKSLAEAESAVQEAERKLAAVDDDAKLRELARQHPDIEERVLRETAKLHEGDAENLRLWREFLPFCREDIRKIYDRLDIRFDQELGESFYHDKLAPVVKQFEERGHARVSDGAICVFLPGFDSPMIVQKQDGAFLYATTDLATIEHRVTTWRPDCILYVVDHRQAEHFGKLFAAARLWGHGDVEFRHISFGTVKGKDGKPFRTREGALGLEWLLDSAVDSAYKVVCANDDAKRNGPELSEQQRRHIASVVGHAAVKYADLSQNRESDYVFDEERMVANEGNTATYMQYSYARVQSIFRRGEIDRESLRRQPALALTEPLERALALEVLRLEEAISDMLSDYRPNLLTNYVYGLASTFAVFFEKLPVLKSEGDVRTTRLVLCDLVARTIRLVLQLLGIQVVDRM